MRVLSWLYNIMCLLANSSIHLTVPVYIIALASDGLFLDFLDLRKAYCPWTCQMKSDDTSVVSLFSFVTATAASTTATTMTTIEPIAQRFQTQKCGSLQPIAARPPRDLCMSRTMWIIRLKQIQDERRQQPMRPWAAVGVRKY